MEYVTPTLLYVLVVIMIFFMIRAFKYALTAQSDFESILSKLKNSLIAPIEEYTTFTDGHPYTWTEVEFETLVAQVRKYIPSRWSINPPYYPKMTCWFSVDNENRRIYLVPYVSQFEETGSLMHYQDWLESEPDVRKNIAEYRRSHS